MKNIHLVNSENIKPVFSFMKKKHLPVEKLMADAGLPLSCLTNEENEPVPAHAFWHFVDLCFQKANQPDLGFQMVEEQGMAVIQKISQQAIAQAVTLHDAMALLIKLIASYSTHAKYWLTYQSDGVWLCGGKVEIQGFDITPMEQIAIANLVCFIRTYLGDKWQPKLIRLQQPQLNSVTQKYFKDSQIIINQDVTAIFIANEFIGTSSPELLSIYDDVELLKGESFQQKLYLAIKPYFGEGLPSLEQLSDILGLSLRQIQRRLKKEGVTFRHVIHKLSFDIAKQHLKNPDYKITDIAFEIGYSDKSHFNRAFQQWSGMAPSVFREKMLRDSK